MDIPNAAMLIYAVATFIPLVIFVVTAMQWMLMGEIDTATGMVGIASAMGVCFSVLKPPHPMLSPVLCILIWATVLFFPLLRSSIDKRALVAIDLESLDKAYEGLESRPDNVGLKLKISKILFGRGLGSHAIVLAEDALKGFPQEMFSDEIKMIAQWKATLGGATTVRSLPCLECGTLNVAGRLHCSKCKAPFLLHHARGNWLGPNLARRVLGCWTAGLALAAGVPLALAYLASWQALIVILALMLAAFAVIWRAFLPERKRSAVT